MANFVRSRRNSIEADPKRMSNSPFPGQIGDKTKMEDIKNPLFDRAITTTLAQPSFEKTFWMPDSTCKACPECGESFNLFKRRHHCRLCGMIFCHACSPHMIDGTSYGYSNQSIRICKKCFKSLDLGTALIEMSNHEMDVPTSPLPVSRTIFDYDTHNGTPLYNVVSDVNFDDNMSDSVPLVPQTSNATASGKKLRRRPSLELHSALDLLDRKDTPLVPMPSIGEHTTSTLLEQHQEVAASQLQALLLHRIEAISLPPMDRQLLLNKINQFISSTTKTFVEMKYFRTHLGFNHQDLIGVKTIATGDNYSCDFVHGIVCHKNVSHKKAPKALEKPRILLFQEGIVFSQASERISSLDTLLDQEKAYISAIVEKIQQLKPDIIFTGQSVSRLAQDLLAESNIALVLNVKSDLLETIARHTGSVLLKNSDSIKNDGSTIIGNNCSAFHVETYLVQDPEKATRKRESYIFLEGSLPEAGGTILLQGPDKAVLRQLKILWRDIAAMAYDLSLQAYVLTDLMYPVVPVSKSKTLHAVKGMVKLIEVPNRPKFVPCSSAQEFTLEYYSPLDKALGSYLFNDCIAPSTKCQNSTCKVPLIDHIQTYSCMDGTILVDVEDLPEKERPPVNDDPVVDEDKPSIYFWRYCRLCEKVVTPFVLLSSMTLQFSFGRFLEIIFTVRGPMLCANDEFEHQCPHDGQTSHLLYFNCGRHAIRVEYVEERPWYVQHDNCLPFDQPWYIECQKKESLELLDALHAFANPILSEINHMPPHDGMFLELLVKSATKLHDSQLYQIINQSDNEDSSLVEVDTIRRDIYHSCKKWVQCLNKIRRVDSDTFKSLRITTSEPSSSIANSQKSSPISASPTASDTKPQLDEALTASLSSLTLENSVASDPPPPALSLTLPPPSTWKSTIESILLRSNDNSPRASLDRLEIPEIFSRGHPEMPPGCHGRVVGTDDDLHFSFAAYALNSDKYEEELAKQKGLDVVSTEGLLTSKYDSTIKLHFEDVRDNEFTCQVHYAIQFEALRSLFYGQHHDFISSIASCLNYSTKGGKSGAKFFRTQDDRFLIKYISQTELQCFLASAVAYCEHIAKVYFESMSSVLSKILGVYTVTHASKKWTEHIVVMENIFCNMKVDTVYDLKGSTRNRYAAPGSGLLDGNFLIKTLGLPSPLHPRSYEKLIDAIKHDVFFLSENNIIDYSLVIGYLPEEDIPDDENENASLKTNRLMLVGIIDYLRHFDFIKRMESVGKSVTMIAGQDAPTIVEPKQYAKRFVDALELQYFMPVPSMGDHF
ncbi:phosphatidylinositol-3-phosphate 5-kinase [Thraustotheca clavata]|uniref:1-phosphatidylinositol-3-phosphate 5-kinase n=1 Tax=Thraustotheca clavata TaxID=74557 RepID=A0A1V9Y7S6_9STRA|nr:phosphatidylinositol-3-phosphate 5-kinase [Thraustotheca clavata]